MAHEILNEVNEILDRMDEKQDKAPDGGDNAGGIALWGDEKKYLVDIFKKGGKDIYHLNSVPYNDDYEHLLALGYLEWTDGNNVRLTTKGHTFAKSLMDENDY